MKIIKQLFCNHEFHRFTKNTTSYENYYEDKNNCTMISTIIKFYKRCSKCGKITKDISNICKNEM